MLSGQADDAEHVKSSGMVEGDGEDGEPISRGRPQRVTPRAKPRPGRHIDGYNELDEMDDESDAPSSGNEWDSGAEDEPDDEADEDEEEDDIEMSDDDETVAREGESEDEDDRRSRSLVVSLRYSKMGSSPLSMDATNGTPALRSGETTFVSHEPQDDPIGVVQETTKAIPSKVTDEHLMPEHESPRPRSPIRLPSTFLPTTYRPPISTVPSVPLPQNPSVEPSGLPVPQLPSAEILGNAHANMLFPKPQSPKRESFPNFQQYEYRPPSK